jgi:hypothetical protein
MTATRRFVVCLGAILARRHAVLRWRHNEPMEHLTLTGNKVHFNVDVLDFS